MAKSVSPVAMTSTRIPARDRPAARASSTCSGHRRGCRTRAAPPHVLRSSTLPSSRHGHCITVQTASADATCGRVSRLAICTNHPLATSRPGPDPSGSPTTTRKSGDDAMIKPPAMARFLCGHAARMPCPPLCGRTVSLVRTYSTAASLRAPCGPRAPRGPWGRA